LGIFPTVFPLFATIFLFLKKKTKRISAPIGGKPTTFGNFPILWAFLIMNYDLQITLSLLQGFQNRVGFKKKEELNPL
jgi:hypothetical protein